MLLFLVLFIIILSTLSMINRRDKHSTLLFFSSISLGIFWIGILIFIAKKGGIDKSVETLLFLTKNLKEVLQFKYIPITRQSYIVAFGRYLFPLFVLLLSLHLHIGNTFKRAKKHWMMFLILPIISLIIYYPTFFDLFISHNELLMSFILFGSVTWVFCYIILSWILIINEYNNISSSYFKKRFLFNTLPIFSMSGLFSLYAPQDPAQIFLFYRNEFMSDKGLWYLSKGLNTSVYVIIGTLSLLSALIGFITLSRQLQIKWIEDKEEAVLRQQNITASNGANIFFHGIKNQLIANKILNKRLFAEIEKSNIDNPEIRNLAATMKINNAQMLEKMETLYQSFRQNEIHFKPIDCNSIIDESILKFVKKYPQGKVFVSSPNNVMVLGDKSYLSEAFYNILTNGWESELEKNLDKQSNLEIIVKEERTHVVFTFKDYGVGISKLNKKKIIEPFFSSKNSVNSWGMGINYTMKIVKNHMGTIRFESKNNITYVDIILPKYKGSN